MGRYVSIVYIIIFISTNSLSKAQSAKQVLNDFIETTGGLKNWLEIKTRYDSTLSHSVKNILDARYELMNQKSTIVTAIKQNGKYRSHFYDENLEIEAKKTFDKKVVCTHLYIEGKKVQSDKESPLSGEKYYPLSLVHELLNAKKVKYEKKLQSDSTTYHVLKVTKQSNEQSIWYFNADTHLLEKSHLDEPIPRFTSHYLDYQEVDGLLVPMVQETRNSKGDLVMRFEKIKVQFNLDLPDDFFTLE